MLKDCHKCIIGEIAKFTEISLLLTYIDLQKNFSVKKVVKHNYHK